MTDKDREAFEALFGKRDKYFSTNVIWDSAWKAWQAATAAERERMEKHCTELSQDAYNRWRADRNPYDDGQCDAANFLSSKIVSGE